MCTLWKIFNWNKYQIIKTLLGYLFIYIQNRQLQKPLYSCSEGLFVVKCVNEINL